MFSRPIAAMASARMPARRIGRVPIADRPTSPVAARRLLIEPAEFVDLDLARNIFSRDPPQFAAATELRYLRSHSWIPIDPGAANGVPMTSFPVLMSQRIEAIGMHGRPDPRARARVVHYLFSPSHNTTPVPRAIQR
jgi:hypothetical protein